MKKILIISVVAVVLVVGGSWFSKNAVSSDPTLVSNNGIHRHSVLEIYTNGEKNEIPPNIGLVGGHSSMHTHDFSGEIHVESDGIVREDDIKLQRFFEIWGKEFGPERLLGYEGEVQMLVNNEVNTEFGEYMLQDGDIVEIRYN